MLTYVRTGCDGVTTKSFYVGKLVIVELCAVLLSATTRVRSVRDRIAESQDGVQLHGKQRQPNAAGSHRPLSAVSSLFRFVRSFVSVY